MQCSIRTRPGPKPIPSRAPIPIATPSPTLGGLVVFDFRLMHRGLPNDTPHARPVAYAVVGRGGARDEV